jgi:hypothetical protein
LIAPYVVGMAKVIAWRRFRRMQSSACLLASLIYAWAGVHAWRVLPGSMGLKCAAILIFPAIYLVAALVLPLAIGPLRRLLKRYVWMSFTAGFGQTPMSVLVGLGVLAGAAGFIAFQIADVARGGRYPMSVFAGYGAGIGILMAQSLLTGALEREAEVQAAIES